MTFTCPPLPLETEVANMRITVTVEVNDDGFVALCKRDERGEIWVHSFGPGKRGGWWVQYSEAK